MPRAPARSPSCARPGSRRAACRTERRAVRRAQGRVEAHLWIPSWRSEMAPPSYEVDPALLGSAFLIGDRSGRLPDLFDAVLSDAGVGVVGGGIEMPGTNCALAGWVHIRRPGCLDRALIWDRYQLRHAVRSSNSSTTSASRIGASAEVVGLHPLSAPITVPGRSPAPWCGAGAVRRPPPSLILRGIPGFSRGGKRILGPKARSAGALCACRSDGQVGRFWPSMY